MLSPTFACPGFARAMKVDTGSLTYVMNSPPGGIKGVSPWGTGAGSTNSTPGAPIARLVTPGQPLSSIWAMQDLDQDCVNTSGVSTYFWGATQAPLHPVHPSYNTVQHGTDTNSIMQAHPGCYRNALFMDFHVGRLNIDGTPK